MSRPRSSQAASCATHAPLGGVIAALALVGSIFVPPSVPAIGTVAAMATQVKSAVEANGQSANLADARKEQSLGRDWCSNGLYDRGISHYERALDLLGVKN